MKLRRTMKAQSSKNKEKKEIIKNNKNKNKKRRRRGPRLGQAKGHASRISVRPKDMQ